MANYKLNFPIETERAREFWGSKHKLNRIKAIIAFSLDLDNANDNLRRHGYYRQYRKRYLEVYSCYVNNPKMDGSDGKQNVPFSDLQEHWWNPTAVCGTITPPVNNNPHYIGFRPNGVSSTAPSGTAPFSIEGEGKQTVRIKNGTTLRVLAGAYKVGSTQAISQGAVNATFVASDPAIAETTLAGSTKYDFDIEAKGLGTTKLVVSVDGMSGGTTPVAIKGTGELTIIVEA